MLDPSFKRSVIFVTDYHKDGTVGFILNKSVKMNINQLLSSFPEFQAEVHYGGPVQSDTIHFLHDLGELIDDSIEVVKGIYWGGNFDQLKGLITSGYVQPSNIRFFVGYSGWSPGQLEMELDEPSWVVESPNPKYVFKGYRNDKLWQQILINKGDQYTVLANIPKSICWS